MTSPTSTKIAAFALAALTSLAVLGTVADGLQGHAQAPAQVIALDTVTVTASKLN